MSLDISIGRGDNAPPPRWVLPFDPTGSDIVVTIDMPGGIELVLSVSDGDLTLDIPNKAVVWYVTAAQSALLPYTSLYKLRRVVTGGEIRYYAQGRIFGVDGPVGPSSVTVLIAGSQGVPGEAGPVGASAYVLAGGDAVWGSLAAWLASPLTPQSLYALYIGDTWAWIVNIVDPGGLMPGGLSGFTVTGQFYAAANAPPASLTVANGGIVILDPIARRVLVQVAPTLTSVVQSTASGVHATVVVTDSAGDPTTLGTIPVNVLSR